MLHLRTPSQSKRSRRSTSRRLAVLAATLGMSAAANAQFRTSLQGSVTDPEGAAIPGATLTLKDNATGTTIVHTSDSAGVFNFNALPADNFTLTIVSPGFQQRVLSNLRFIPEQPNSLDVHLDLGQVSETVNVDASEVPALDTSTANIGATISSNDIQHLPSFNRDVFTLSQLAPGAISDGSQAAAGGVYNLPGNQGPGGSGAGGGAPTENRPQANANGNRNDANGISIDGISTVSAVWGGASVITPTEDSIDNVRIVTNDYDAENGRFSGAQTLVTSKAGTNQLHGSAFIAIHRPGLNAYQPSTGVGKPLRDTQRFNQYGGSLGGPIWKDRLFAFFAYESSPNGSTATSNGWYETSAFRSALNANSIASKYIAYPGSAVTGTVVTTGETCAVVGLREGVNCRTIAGQGLDIGSPLKTALGTQDLTSPEPPRTPASAAASTASPMSPTTPPPAPRPPSTASTTAASTPTSPRRITSPSPSTGSPREAPHYNGGSRAENFFNHSQINEALSVIYNHTFSPTFLNEARANARRLALERNRLQPAVSPWASHRTTSPSLPPPASASFGTALGSIINQWTYRLQGCCHQDRRQALRQVRRGVHPAPLPQRPL